MLYINQQHKPICRQFVYLDMEAALTLVLLKSQYSKSTEPNTYNSYKIPHLCLGHIKIKMSNSLKLIGKWVYSSNTKDNMESTYIKIEVTNPK